MGTLALAMALKWAAIVLLPGAAMSQQPQTATQAQTTPPPSQTQPPGQPPPATEATEEIPPSLFDEQPRQFEFGGRWSSIEGDPARWQRYQDLRDGALFTKARFERNGPDDRWLFKAGGDNVGWRDQRFFADYDRPGMLSINGLWDQIPQFYSVDTRTAFQSQSEGVLVLPDETQRAIQNGQATLNAYVPLASQFDLRERRDIGTIALTATPARNWDITSSFVTTKHSGELPWGASFGFNNDVEVALPYDSRTNDFTVGAEWTNTRSMVRVAYDGTWFNDLSDTLVWDSPLRLDDSTSAPGRGRTAVWPSNSAQTVSVAGYYKLARRSQVTGFLSFGDWSNNEPLQPFTINSALPQFALPRSTADAGAHVLSLNLNAVSRPSDEWRLSARLRHYGYDNQMAATAIPTFINYDTSEKVSSTGGPELFGHSRTTFEADATWTGLQPVALGARYVYQDNGYDFRTFESAGENALHLTADAVGSQWLTFRAHYEIADRTGSGLDEESLVEIGEQPAMRHYDLANRTRNRFTGQVDVTPNDKWMFSLSTGLGKDDYNDSYFGLQEATTRNVTLSADFGEPNGWGGGGSYSYERYAGLQRSRSASPGQTPPQETDPLRDWTVDSTERVHYLSVYLQPPRFGATEARLSYDYAKSNGDYIYGVVPGGPLPTPSPLPEVFNKLQQLHVDVRHRLTNHLAATFSYLYEPFDVFDFAMDPSVINGIIQGNTMVLGYVYRPYTAHSAVFGLKYFW
jgi:MtrB/PioB family decaheme-associated outer membrane protein